MAREVREAEFDPVWFVPDVDNNRDHLEEDDEPFKVLIEAMSGEQLQKSRRGMGKMTRGRTKPNFIEDAQATQRKIIGQRVLEVKGYKFRQKNGEIVEAKTGAQLYDLITRAGGRELDILDQIQEAIEDESVLDEGLLEKLRSRSDSSAPRTESQRAGAANGAAERSSGAPSGQTKDAGSTETATG